MCTTGALLFTDIRMNFKHIQKAFVLQSPLDTFSFKSSDSSADATINVVTNPQWEGSDDKEWEVCQPSEKGLSV